MAAARIAGDIFAGGGVSREAPVALRGSVFARVLETGGIDSSLSHEQHLETYLEHLFLPTHRDGGEIVVVAARDDLTTWRAARETCGFSICIVACPRQVVVDAIQARFRDRLAQDAQFALDRARPAMSARRVLTQTQRWIIVALLAVITSVGVASPQQVQPAAYVALAALYAATVGLRYLLFAAGWSLPKPPRQRARLRVAACEAPTYSVLVPLFHEANMMGEITRALRRLDYPNLDIKLIFEECDTETISAARALELDERFEILVVPPSSIRTKPRACNYALPFVRGEYVVIFDAEDRPEPDQLIKAVAAFRARPDFACFQARLAYYNAESGGILANGLMAQTPLRRIFRYEPGMAGK